MQFIVDADPQFDDVKIRDTSCNNVDIIGDIVKNNDVKFMLVCGDLTHNGSDGKSQLCSCCIPSGVPDQLTPFLDDYLYPIENMGIPVYLAHGNHDEYVSWPYIRKPVLDFIQDRYGGLNYFFDVHVDTKDIPGIRVVCCGKYPNEETLKWLEMTLVPSVGAYMFYFHYPCIGNLSGNDWWSKEEKSDFYSLIKRKKING